MIYIKDATPYKGNFSGFKVIADTTFTTYKGGPTDLSGIVVKAGSIIEMPATDVQIAAGGSIFLQEAYIYDYSLDSDPTVYSATNPAPPAFVAPPPFRS